MKMTPQFSYSSLRRGEAYRVLSHPCFFNQWLFSQEFPMSRALTKVNENLSADFAD